MATTISWKPNANGDWATKTNWTPARAPGAKDTVLIDTSAHHTVTFSTGSAAVKSLTVGNDDFAMTGGALALAATSSFAGALTVGNASLTLNGATSVAGLFTGNDHMTLAGKGALTLGGGSAFSGSQLMTGAGTTILKGTSSLASGDVLGLDKGRVLENQGTLTLNDHASIWLGHNPLGGSGGKATLQNDAAATLIFDNDTLTNAVQLGKGALVFTNAGSVQNIGTGETQITTAFTNTGTVSVAHGQLDVNARMTGGGTVGVSAGATFVLDATKIGASNAVSFSNKAGTVHLAGGSAADTLAFAGGFAKSDIVNGGAGNDTLSLTGSYTSGLTLNPTTVTNVETLKFGAGFTYNITSNDATVAAHATLNVDASALGASNVLIFNGAVETDGYFSMKGGAGNDVLTGGDKGDAFDITAGGNDRVTGNDGDDTVLAGAALSASDRIDGGVGNDMVKFTGDYSGGLALSGTIVNVEKLAFSKAFNYALTSDDGLVGTGLTVNVDASALGKANALTFDGSAESDGHFNFLGGAGNDVLTGGALSDDFQVGAGNDTVNGSGGDDTIRLNDLTATDRVDGGAGNDTVHLSGNYTTGHAVVMNATTMTNVETLYLSYTHTGFGYDITTNDATVAVGQTLTVDGPDISDEDTQQVRFDGSAETNGTFVIHGGENDDILIGGAGNDTITGSGGNDTINGGLGADTMTGGAGTNTYYVDNVGDVIVQQSGAYAIVNTTLSSYSESAKTYEVHYIGSSNFAFTGLTGGAGAVFGGAGNDTFDSGPGIYYLQGNLGDDTYIVRGKDVTVAESSGGGNDTVQTTLAAYTLANNVETLTFIGSGAFTGTGNASNNTITGGSAADTLAGGAGADMLTGGGGADHFVFTAAAQSTGAGYDTITDFDTAQDRIDTAAVSGVDTAVTAGALSTASFDTDLTTAINAAHLGKHHAVLFTADTGTLAGEQFLVVDINGKVGYQAGQDLVVHLDAAIDAATLVKGDFI